MNQTAAGATVILLVAAVLAPSAISAQPASRLPDPLPRVVPTGGEAVPILGVTDRQTLQATDSAEASIAALLAGGVLAAGLSAALGAVIGYQVTRQDGGEDPGLNGLAVGWLAGPAIVTPITVHALNQRRGSLGLSYALAAGIALAGAATMQAPVIFIASPVLQTISATIVQRNTGH